MRVSTSSLSSNSTMALVDSTVTKLDTSSVRDFRVLGSKSTASVCNTETVTNIIIVAAGEKRTNIDHVGCAKRFASQLGPGCSGFGVVKSRRRVNICGRVTRGN